MPPGEPERYSIDEMMDRLKKSSSDDSDKGELVTRADGSQAIKVRKRKRRTDQPHKKTANRTFRNQMIQISGVLILSLLTAAVIGGAVVYSNSAPFRKNLLGHLEKASGATAQLVQFRMNPRTANAGQVALKWPEGNFWESATLNQLSAEVAPVSFLGKKMVGGEVEALSGEITFRFPKSNSPVRHSARVEGLAPIDYKRYRTQELALRVGPLSSPVLQLSKTQGSFAVDGTETAPQMSLYQGDLALAGWPKMRLDRALILFSGDALDVKTFRVFNESDSRGFMDFTGKIRPYQSDEKTTLMVEFDAFQFSSIVGSSFGSIISGKIDSRTDARPGNIAFFPKEDSAAELEAPFRVNPGSQIEFRGFPFLFALASAFDDPWFERPAFQTDANGVIYRKAGTISLKDVDFQSRGRMTLQGSITVAPDQALSGQFRIGISEPILASSKNDKLKSLFSPPEEGIRWINVKLSGTSVTPKDNLDELLNAGQTSSQKAPEASKANTSTFEELTKPR